MRTFGRVVTPGPVIGVEGSALVAANDGVLRALDPATGTTRRTFDGHGSYGVDLSVTPAVLADGTILWPAPGNRLIALDKGGNELWREDFDGYVLSPAVVGDGRAYVADQAGTVKAIDLGPGTHTVAWTLRLGGSSYSSPAVGPGRHRLRGLRSDAVRPGRPGHLGGRPVDLHREGDH